MSNVKINNFEWTLLTAEQSHELGVNLLDGIFPEITSLGETPFSCEILGNWDEAQMSTVTDDNDIPSHIDLRGIPFSLTYDLGEVRHIDTIHLTGFSIYAMNGFKLYASDNREDLYEPQNMIVEYYTADDSDQRKRDWLYQAEGTLRYFGFLATHSCVKDEILRLARIALFADSHTAKYRTVKKYSTSNLIEGITPDAKGGYDGNPKDICGSRAYFPEEMLTAKSDLTLTYTAENTIDIGKIYILGKNVKVKEIYTEGNAIDFTEERSSTYEGEEMLCLKADISGKEFSITLSDGSVLDLVFSDTKVRRGEVNLNQIVCHDFLGNATNLIPTYYTEMGREGGANEVFWEMEKHHISKAKPHCARLWFQIDWITDNKDDYYARKYTFDSDAMQSVKKYLEACRDSGTEILFNFGWKISSSIQDWFCMGGMKETFEYGLRMSAPADLNQYGIALADTLEHLILDCGFDNIKYVTFYNEPQPIVNKVYSDFAMYGDKTGYWASMLLYAHHHVNNSKVKGMVDFWGVEQAADWGLWMERLNMLVPEKFAAHSLHIYNYSYDALCKLYKDEVLPNRGGKAVYITELGNCVRSDISWDTNHINSLLAGANMGVSGGFNWILSGAPLVDPLNWWHIDSNDMDNSYSFWNFLPKAKDLNHTGEVFYEFSLFAHYVPNHSKSVKCELVHDYKDFRVCGFTFGGDYTVCVENKGDNENTDISVKLSRAVNKKFYKYVYRHHTDKGEANLTVPHAEAVIEVGDTITDTLGSGYEFAVYSTLPPIRQVLMSECDIRVAAGTTVTVTAEVLGCDYTPTWSISQSLMEGATQENGVVTIPATAKPGEMLALKAQLHTGEYGISIIRVI